MKYETIIKVTTDAENKNEATEIVGDYLSGHIVSGVDMKCQTRPVYGHAHQVVAVLVVLFFVTVGVFSTIQVKTSQSLVPNLPSISAVQPPLKTAGMSKKDLDFKKKWEAKQAKEILEYIKR